MFKIYFGEEVCLSKSRKQSWFPGNEYGNTFIQEGLKKDILKNRVTYYSLHLT